VRHSIGDAFGDQRFDIVRPLGSGGFGAVYEAFDHQSNQRVALKELTRVGPSALVRFKQEFRALSDVHHPNLVSIKELIEQGGRWYIVMELVEGEDLLDFVCAESPGQAFDEERLRQAFLAVADGLEALHGYGILHRDLKPSNVRVTPEGRAVLLDFGLITSVETADQSTHAAGVGTVLYMAPEQLHGHKLGTATDWYAFGTCLYEALTGRLPYEGSTPTLIAIDKTQRDPVHPNMHASGLPEDLATLSIALLSRSPEARPAGDQVRSVLEGIPWLGARSAMAVSSAPSPPRVFAGRVAEIEHLERALARTDEGALRIVLVEGESGVGKSELVAEFLRQQQARAPRTLTLRARCYENEHVAYKAFDGCIDELAYVLKRMGPAADALMPVDAGLLAQLFPVLGDVPAIAQAQRGNVAADPTARRLQAFAALAALLSQLAEERPLILSIDDLQWADAESFRLLRALVEDARRPPILILCTLRPRQELEPDILASLEAVRALQCVDVIPIIGLPRPQAEELATLLLGPGADPKWAHVIAVESRGHPLFLSELIHFSKSRDLSASGTLTLEAALQSRIERLPKQACALLELVALAGRPHRVDLFAEALEIAKLDEAISVLLGAKLLRTRRDQELGCFHDRIRHVTVSLVPSARLPHLHKLLAKALERAFDADPTEVATHWDLADEPEKALDAYEKAADQALASLAFVQAERLYARALELLGTARDERYTRLMIGRASAVGCAGRSAEAATLYQRAAQLNTSEEQRLRLRSKTAQHLMLSGDVHTGLAACRQLLAELGVSLPRSNLAAFVRSIWDRLWLRLGTYRPKASPPVPTLTEARDVLVLELLTDLMKALAILRTGAYLALSGQHARRAVALANPVHVAHACANEGWLANARGKVEIGTRLFARARELNLQTGNPGARAVLAQQEGSAHISNWDWTAGCERLEEAERLYQAHAAQDSWSLTVTRYLLGTGWYRLGEHVLLAQKMDVWIGEARERLDRVSVALLSGMGHGSARHLMRGAPNEALRELEDAIAAVPSEPFSFAHLGHLICSQHALIVLGGRAAQAWFEVREKQLKKPLLLKTAFGVETLRLLRCTAALRAYEVAAPSERTRLLAEVRANARAMSGRKPIFTRSFASHFLAQAAALEGATESALEHARAARQGFEQIKYVGAHAVSFLEGTLEAGQGGTQKCAAALAAYSQRGWVDPEQGMIVVLPVLSALAQRQTVSKTPRKKLIHHYEVIAPLGNGGFGAVFEARDVHSGRHVALKELANKSGRSLERFKQEFRALSDLHHPNLVRFDALFEQQGSWYIVMELVRGQDLVSYARPSGQLDHARMRHAFTGLVAGVSALHEAGFVHRDISPDNVCVTEDGRAVLLDFGLIARAHDSREAFALGKADYAAPEQLEGVTPHASADIYALGGCLYHALSGRPPFEGAAHPALSALKRTRKPRPLSAPKLRVWSTCASRMLEPNPAARPILADVILQLASDEMLTPSRPAAISVVPDAAAASSFEGRAWELTQLRSAAEQAQTGFRLVLVKGESGLGKSALVAEFARRYAAERSDVLVLASRCYENERLALKAFDGIVDQLASALRALSSAACEELLPKKSALLAQLFPVLGSVQTIAKAAKKTLPADPVARRLLALSCFVELLERLSAKRPVLLLIDDLQWADAESLRLLSTLSSSGEKLPLCAVSTLRPREEFGLELAAEFGSLSAQASTRILQLKQLSREDMEALSAAMLGPTADPALLRRLSEESKGHPHFLRELVEHSKSGAARAGAALISLDDALSARLARFDPEARRLVALLALVGRPYSTQVFAAALGRAELPLESLNELLNQGLVRRRGEDGLTCYHDRVRNVALSSLSEAGRRELCAKLAAALDSAPGCEAAERARLWDDAGESEQAIRAFEAAGDAALEKLAFEAADQHYMRALELAGDKQDARWGRIACQRGHALVRMGKNAQAARLYAAAAQGAEGAQRVRLRVWAAQNLIQGAQVEAGLAAASDLLAELGVPLPRSEGAAKRRIVLESARLKLRGIKLQTATAPLAAQERLVLDALNELSQPVASVMFLHGAALSVQHVRRALNAGEPAHAARALAYEGILRSTRAPEDDHSALFARAYELAQSGGDPAVLASVEIRAGIACLARDDYEGGRDALLRGHEIVTLQCPGQPWLLSTARMQLGAAWYVLGEHGTLAKNSAAWVADAKQREDLFGYAALASYGFGFIRHLMRDDPAAARTELAEAMAPWPDEPFATSHFGAALGHIFTLLYPGGDAGLRWFGQNQARLDRAAILRNHVFRLTLTNLRTTAYLAATGGPGDSAGLGLAIAAVERQARSLSKATSPMSRAFSIFWRSVLFALRGDTRRARAEAAVAQQRLHGMHKLIADVTQYWEGWLEGGESGRKKCEQTTRTLRAEGWVDPQRAVAMILPVFHLVPRG
jgi:serine/threonine protein kinase/predicted ATPase